MLNPEIVNAPILIRASLFPVTVIVSQISLPVPDTGLKFVSLASFVVFGQ